LTLVGADDPNNANAGPHEKTPVAAVQSAKTSVHQRFLLQFQTL